MTGNKFENDIQYFYGLNYNRLMQNINYVFSKICEDGENYRFANNICKYRHKYTIKTFVQIKEMYENTKIKFNIDLINNDYQSSNSGFLNLLENLITNFYFENENRYLLKLIYWYNEKIINKSKIVYYDIFEFYELNGYDYTNDYYSNVLYAKEINNIIYIANYKYFIKYFIKYIIENLKTSNTENVFYFCNKTLKNGDTTTFKYLQKYIPILTAKIDIYHEIFKCIINVHKNKYSLYYQYLFATELNISINFEKFEYYLKHKQILKWI